MSDMNVIAAADASNAIQARRTAVVAALELIKADAEGGARTGSFLEVHLENLGKYADQIQGAVVPTQ